MNKKDEVERKITSIFDHAKFQALAVIHAEPEQATVAADQPVPEFLTEEELMVHWRLDSTAGIQSWRKRPRNEFPLPFRYVGDKIRYNRKETDQWLMEETLRRDTKRLAKKKSTDDDQRRGLSAV